ncbi:MULTISPECIES: ATP-dependent zinc metalloprotease FtsH [unclassified Pyramidobacter]|uniref:ATP-dependent zinc metalloprotease FtsH n=1 Tax=unclassified Pyramidobacter TaxID=2632171 RepID=UPI000EA2F5CE|nr:ATP-dependent zinc metalloprotease FtsH [Pyramidobacter sp. CG50-2]RKJ81498.1 ATP-dependent metallopeptidase FtsH/Yme1/Tma family protein [Pyramidobacter sp. CG50-2]
MQRLMKNLGVYLILVVLVVSVVNMFLTPQTAGPEVAEIPYSQFRTDLAAGRIKNFTINDMRAQGRYADGKAFVSNIVGVKDVAEEAAARGVEVKIAEPPETPWWMTLASSVFPTLLLIGVWIFFLHNMQGGGGKVMSFAKSKAKMFLDNRPKVTFNDVAGCDEAKEELKEVVEFLKSPDRFTKLGAKVPKGVLLLGSPGTGKTLLARACAGEADVPFFSTSGSDFVEMFVGVGASRVRDLFEQARKYQPCLVFIDEIDAVGRQRGTGLGGGHDEREQTLNQLLVEMDGFDEKTGIILIAATNRADVLDPALLRPGRFDRHVVVDTPDVKGREAILKVHAKDKKFAPDVDFKVLAKRTPGFVGADLANVINEAALLAARGGKTEIGMAELEEGIDRSIAGPERKSRLIGPREKKIIAYHETGHAMVAKLIPGCDPVHKISIIPRGSAALGYTLQLPAEDRFLASKNELTNNICVLLGGRVTEELVFGDITTGASNDLERATQVARSMVTQYGMSSLGPVVLGRQRHEVFLGRDLGEDRNYSDQIAFAIDEEVRKIVEECYVRVKNLLSENRDKVDLVAETLLEREVMDGHDLAVLLGEEEPVPEKPEEKPASEGTDVPAPEGTAPAGEKATDGFIPRAPVVSNEMAPMTGKEPPSAKGE